MTSHPRKIDKRQSLEKMLLELKARGLYPGIYLSGRMWQADANYDMEQYKARTPSAALRKAIRAWEQEQKK